MPFFSIDTNASKLEAILDNNPESEFPESTGSNVINLATIEEQPELGYQSDSEVCLHFNQLSILFHSGPENLKKVQIKNS